MNGIALRICAGVVMSASAVASAGLVYDGTATLTTSAFSALPGGEFTLTPVSGFVGITGLAADLSPGTFETFCVERNETFSSGGTYGMIISTEAVQGGSGGPSYPLDPRAAYLYFNFRTLSLTGFDYSPAGRQGSSGALQAALWFIQGNQSGGANNAFVALAQAAISSGAWSGLGDVRVLNVYDANSGLRQDQLTIIPTPGVTALVGVGAALITRRRRD